MAVYEACDNTFICESLYQNNDGTRIVAMLRNNLGERSCDIFDFVDGLIVKEYEFIIGWQTSIGLIVFILGAVVSVFYYKKYLWR